MSRPRSKAIVIEERVASLIEELETMKERKRETELQKVEAIRVAEQDHEEQCQLWEEAVLLFNDNSQALHETSGRRAHGRLRQEEAPR